MAAKNAHTPRASVEESIIHALFDLSNHLMRRGERFAAEVGLTTQQWIVLLQIAGDPNFPGAERTAVPGVLPSDIAAARGVSRATVSVVVRGLVERKLVDQREDADDRRKKRLYLTKAGQRVVAKLQPTRRAANRRLLAKLSASQRKAFLGALTTCLDTLATLEASD